MARARLNDADLAERLQAQPSTLRAWHIPEPDLVFGREGRSPDPKTGLANFGPWGLDEGQPLLQLRLGIVGTGETIQNAQHWVDRCRRRVDPRTGDDVDPILFPSFPGMEGTTGFGCKVDAPSSLVECLTPAEIRECEGAPNRDTAVEKIARVVGERLGVLAAKGSPPDVVIVALTSAMRTLAGGGRLPARRPRAPRARPQLTLAFMDDPRPADDSISRTLHRAIKAEGMRTGLCTQMCWPGSFIGGEGVEDDATRAWNFCTALYYKATGIPWRITGLAKNTCYVGISFFRPLRQPGMLQTSMAQAFSDRGEGVVLLGDSFEWDPRKQGSPRLSRAGARGLLERVLALYTDHIRQPPSRVVVHKSSLLSQDEVGGFQEAIPSTVPYHDFLSVGRTGIRFMRAGAEPPLRGTLIEIAKRRYLLYTRGYVPFLRVYPGLRIPRPLHIAQHVGSGAVTEVLAEVLALTKMNWNSAVFGRSEPITLGFSRTVGLILSELPRGFAPKASYRYYM
jgi:hypothetical protein